MEDNAPKIEPKKNNYEHAHVLAGAVVKQFLERYDLKTGYRREGTEFNQAMDFWSYELFSNNKTGQKPESEEELVAIFEEIINDNYKFNLEQNPKSAPMDEAYNYFVLGDKNVPQYIIDGFGQGINNRLKKRYQNESNTSKDTHFTGFNNEPGGGRGRT